MDGLDGLLGGLAEMLFGGAAELGIERTGETVVEGALVALGIDGGDGAEPAATYGRYLTGAPRALNVNDF